MLFNTLAYARFFGVVFIAAWLLVERRNALLLPWLAWAATMVLALPSPLGLGLAALCGGLTVVVMRRLPRDEPPPLSWMFASVCLHGGALTYFTVRYRGLDPWSWACQALSLPHCQASLGRYWTLGVVASLVLLAGRQRKVRLLFLLVASYIFYAHWDWRFLPLIWGSSSLDWWLGKAIGKSENPRQRKAWLVITVVVNLGVLGLFKYYDFGVATVRELALALGTRVPDVALHWALPIGVSFFTFESMSYVIDVYRRQLEPHESYLEYLGFVAFFPHLVAGPIVRPRDLLPQLAGPPRFSAEFGSDGLYLVAQGLVKKLVIGDTLAVGLIDRVFDAPLQYSGLECYLAVVGYALQIYCDFSGYTDIAIGSAALLGIRFPVNFRAPYRASNITEFWHRWHISLSTWLRDYLYIPLGGNRKGPVRTYINLMLTMLLGGLWHGANWTFVVWGGIHGVSLAIARFWERRRGVPSGAASSGLRRWVGVLLTFHLVCVAWVFFRAESFSAAWLMFQRMATLSTYHPNLHLRILAILALGLGVQLVPEGWASWARRSFARLPVPAQAFGLLLVAILLRQMATAEAVPFVYFQF